MKQKMKAILPYVGIPVFMLALMAVGYFVLDNFWYANLSDFSLIVRFFLACSSLSFMYLFYTFSVVFSTLYFAATLNKGIFEKKPLRRWGTVAISVSVALFMNLLHAIIFGKSGSRGVFEFLVNSLLSGGICFLILFYRYRVWRWEKQMTERLFPRWVPLFSGAFFVLCCLFSLLVSERNLIYDVRVLMMLYAVIIGATLKKEKKSGLALLLWTAFTGAALFVSLTESWTMLENFGPPVVDYILIVVWSVLWCPLGYLCAARKPKKMFLMSLQDELAEMGDY